MKSNVLIAALLFSFALFSQESTRDGIGDSILAEKQKIKHSFLLSGGMYAQKKKNFSYGGSTSFAYQMYFPSRFILGIEYLIGRSVKMDGVSMGSGNSYSKNIESYAVLGHIGVQIVRRKKVDFSIMVIPHYIRRKHLRTTFLTEKKEYVNSNYKETFVFMPFLFHRAELYYKFNKMNSVGLTLDVGYDIEWMEFWGGRSLFFSHFMLSYRFTIP